MVEWPTPRNFKQLRGFLGLTGYYRRFIKHYGILAKPLTCLLQKDGFQWTEASQVAFERLKLAMTLDPVLALPGFKKPFVIEKDASGLGLGVVMMQDGHPLAFLSKSIAPKHRGLPVYEKEFMVIVLAVKKRRPYLIGRHFIIKTDHISLKYLMEQKVNTLVSRSG